jgi:hypothetical protein
MRKTFNHYSLIGGLFYHYSISRIPRVLLADSVYGSTFFVVTGIHVLAFFLVEHHRAGYYLATTPSGLTRRLKEETPFSPRFRPRIADETYFSAQ